MDGLATRRRLSELFTDLLHDTREKITLIDMMRLLSDRSFGFFLLLLAFPNIFIMPPGTSTVLGMPLILISWQLMRGRPTMWLPERIGTRGLSTGFLKKIITRTLPTMMRVERWLRPRWSVLTGRLGDRVVGGVSLFLACILIFPLPAGNSLPALSIVLMSLGLIEEDGLLVATGLGMSVIAVTVCFSVIIGLILGANWIIDWWPF